MMQRIRSLAIGGRTMKYKNVFPQRILDSAPEDRCNFSFFYVREGEDKRCTLGVRQITDNLYKKMWKLVFIPCSFRTLAIEKATSRILGQSNPPTYAPRSLSTPVQLKLQYVTWHQLLCPGLLEKRPTLTCLIIDYYPGGELFMLLDRQLTNVLKEDDVRSSRHLVFYHLFEVQLSKKVWIMLCMYTEQLTLYLHLYVGGQL